MSDEFKSDPKIGTIMWPPHKCLKGGSHYHPGYLTGWIFEFGSMYSIGYEQMLDFMVEQGFKDGQHSARV